MNVMYDEDLTNFFPGFTNPHVCVLILTTAKAHTLLPRLQ
jgi:hypothetical protein